MPKQELDLSRHFYRAITPLIACFFACGLAANLGARVFEHEDKSRLVACNENSELDARKRSFCEIIEYLKYYDSLLDKKDLERLYIMPAAPLELQGSIPLEMIEI